MQMDKETIVSKEFEIEKKGYKKSEVKEFLQVLAEEFEENKNRITALEEETHKLNLVLNEYQEMETQIRDAIIFLNESEKEAINKTRNEVSEILKNAETKRDNIIEEAESEAKSTRDTLLFLKEQQELLIMRMKILVSNQESMLDNFSKGNVSAHLQKSIAEAAAYRAQVEMNVDEILEKLL